MTKIGNVEIKQLTKNHGRIDAYADSSEEYLLKLFEKPEVDQKKLIQAVLDSNPTWPILYHLSPQRQQVLSWYAFNSNSTLLEIGAGCGSLTGMFSSKVNRVIANELTPIRGEIIAKRFADRTNVEVVIGNLQDLIIAEKVDYISVIGVLEYSGRYLVTDKNNFYDPYVNFLRILKKFLKPNGHILLAIENKLAYKYIAGGREDHYGNLFSSLENYPHYTGIRTFTRTELQELINDAGFSKANYFYPFPDYKLPLHIFSEKAINGELTPISISSFAQIVDKSNERTNLFNEIMFVQSLIRAKIFQNFANAFVVDISI